MTYIKFGVIILTRSYKINIKPNFKTIKFLKMQPDKGVTRTEESSIGNLNFHGEDFFYVNLVDIPRERRLVDLVDQLVTKKRLNSKERWIITRAILEKAPSFKAPTLTMYFFHLRADERGSILKDVEAAEEKYFLKGDPLAMAYLNLLDLDSSFVTKYPHMSLFKKEEEMYCFSTFISETAGLEGFNMSTSSVRRQSGYFPKQFWVSGIRQHIQ